jgi:hypothetical protein
MLFMGYYLILKQVEISFYGLAIIAILFRILFLFAVPNLSQDFYRFIWDGRMLLNGLNPYISIPETFIRQQLNPVAETKLLYEGMGALNGSHFTNYPPLNQLCFLIAAIFASKNIFGAIVTFRLLIIFADIGILYFGKKILEHLNLPIKNIFWYFLNPFIIIEMTGNLHFEPVMLFFLVWAFYKLQQQKWIWAALLIACSISIKLIPLLFLPLFYQWFLIDHTNLFTSKVNKFKKLFFFYILVIATILLLFVPFYTPELISKYSQSVGLWFGKFEFNGSFYYIFREIGYALSGYNEIALIGKITAVLSVLYILFLSLFMKNHNGIPLYTSLLFSLCFYYFASSTVHPWYIATPLILCVFTNYRFPIVWSFLLFLTYQAYANTPWKENLWFVLTEYTCLFSFIIYEIHKVYKLRKT